MIGTRLKRRDDASAWTITAHDGGRFIVNADEFGPTPEAHSPASLAEIFDVAIGDLREPESDAERIARLDAERNRGLNQRYGRAHGTALPPAGPLEGSPEWQFAREGDDEAA